MRYPYLRKAEPRDYHAIWSIWMQDHIICWMSFTKQTESQFKAKYEEMQRTSDIYVLVDKIGEEDTIVAVRRIKFGKNEYQHVAEYCSMGVHQDYLNKGYAKLLYAEFKQIANKMQIKRIQLTQSGGNMAAFHLADTMKFVEEARFPDWLERHNNDGKYHLIERYMTCIIDPDLAYIASQLQSLKYQDILPSLHAIERQFTVTRCDYQFICFINGRELLTINLEPDNSVIQHIGFLTIQLHMPEYIKAAVSAFRQVLSEIVLENRLKKLELFTAEPMVAELCKQLGFFVRGERMAAYFNNGKYSNEVGVELSFFAIDDAKQLLLAQLNDKAKYESISTALDQCAITIQSLIDSKECDYFAARYFENIAYQIVRDDLGPNLVFSLMDKRWEHILDQCPLQLTANYRYLRSLLTSKLRYGFFTDPLSQSVEELQVVRAATP